MGEEERKGDGATTYDSIVHAMGSMIAQNNQSTLLKIVTGDSGRND